METHESDEERDQTSPPEAGLRVFQMFPEIVALGRDALQRLCDEWLKTPQASAHGVTAVVVHDDLRMDLGVQITSDAADKAEFFFPMDDLLFFIVERGIQEASKRQRTRARIIGGRQRGGPDVFQRFAIAGPRRTLFVKCKNPDCRNTMDTGLRPPRRAKVSVKAFGGRCPRCGQVCIYVTGDLFFID